MARRVFTQGIHSLQQACQRVGAHFEQAVELLSQHQGKAIICGVGKSGYVAHKLASSLCSTGCPAVFLNANEAIHGDLGVYRPGDPTVLVSKSGSTPELLRLVPILRQFGSPLIGILGNVHSPLGDACTHVLDASVATEADPLGIVPTTSTLLALAWGDSLVCAIMLKRKFEASDFARFHPGGQLGRNLLLTVADVMHPTAQVACLTPQDSLRQAVIAMTEKPLGAACVLDDKNQLLGLLTDGDIRRTLLQHEDIRGILVEHVMTRHPKTIDPGCLLGQALQVMEGQLPGKPTKQISTLPVLCQNQNTLLGLIRIHDIYKPL
jgi:arabinose-5-phosphate isomerase